MKGGMGVPRSQRSTPQSSRANSPRLALSTYDSSRVNQESSNIDEAVDHKNLSSSSANYPIPINDLDEIDIESLFSPLFDSVNKEAIKTHTYEPISSTARKNDSIFVTAKRTVANIYFQYTLVCKVLIFCLFYGVGIAFYTSNEGWSLLNR